MNCSVGQLRGLKKNHPASWMVLLVAAAIGMSGDRLVAATFQKDPPQPLNLISIVTDDLADWSLGSYGNRESRTPNIDRLAHEGARFKNAFVPTPVCSASRASFLTGLYSTQTGITDFIHPGPERDLGLPGTLTTWPEVLRAHGYKTALIGKWHLGTAPRFHPTQHGFDIFYGFLGCCTDPMDPILEVDGKDQKFQGATADLVTDEALRFIENQATRPFALSLHFREPHIKYVPVRDQDMAPFTRLDPTVPLAPGLDEQQIKNWTREYYASVHSIDRNVGRLLQKLNDLQLSGHTIILFTSDHGYMIGHHGLHGKGNARWAAGGVPMYFPPPFPNMYEMSLRVPLLVRWPGIGKRGTEISEAISNVDTFASVLGMLGIPMPKGVTQEGADFSPLLRGQRIPWRDAVFGQYDLHNSGLAFMRAIRTGDWKLVRYYGTNSLDMLFHLKDDPGEATNLYGKSQTNQIQQSLQERLTAWMQSIDDPILRWVNSR